MTEKKPVGEADESKDVEKPYKIIKSKCRKIV